MRVSIRKPAESREISFEKNINKYAEGSCLVSFGNTKVICTASVDTKIPKFLQNKNQGWLTAEYGMLPRSTHTRMRRESASGKPSGRTQEIQRLIGRSLRAALDLKLLGQNQILIDCDVIQADGGTRTAAISGAYVALELAIKHMLSKGMIKKNPIKSQIAAISCGVSDGEVLVDLDYQEDSNIDIDANIVLNSEGHIIEIQASAEQNHLTINQLNKIHKLSLETCKKIFKLQKDFIET
jgi:ribonuclease PH